MRYLAISGEDSSTYLLVCDKSCFVHSKSVHVLLAQARPAMINHHTSSYVVMVEQERSIYNQLYIRQTTSHTLDKQTTSRTLGSQRTSRTVGSQRTSRTLGSQTTSRTLGSQTTSRTLGTQTTSCTLGTQTTSCTLDKQPVIH